MQIQLSWIDRNTGDRRQPLLETPVAIGSEFTQMPPEINGKQVSRMVIQGNSVANYHALIHYQNQELSIIDNSNIGININGVQSSRRRLQDGDRIQIGECEIFISFSVDNIECDHMVGFLFKRRCGRTDKTNCADCNESDNNDPYFYEYSYYETYGNYRSGHWGSDYYHNRDRYHYDPSTGNVDFTDADSVSFENERDVDFERHMGAS
ncbi:MAG: FHA domain-containing protein [Rhizonema sp. PD37]|nr:FHA domain-containing protein [Rhizonema sp. PD37]